jgi:hypothetical protein
MYDWMFAIITFCGRLVTVAEPFFRGVAGPGRITCFSPGNVFSGAYFYPLFFTPLSNLKPGLERTPFTAKYRSLGRGV